MDFTSYSDKSTTLWGCHTPNTLVKETAKDGACLEPAQSSDSHSKLFNLRQDKTSVSFGVCICEVGTCAGRGRVLKLDSFKAVSCRKGPTVPLLQFRSRMLLDGPCVKPQAALLGDGVKAEGGP